MHNSPWVLWIHRYYSQYNNIEVHGIQAIYGPYEYYIWICYSYIQSYFKVYPLCYKKNGITNIFYWALMLSIQSPALQMINTLHAIRLVLWENEIQWYWFSKMKLHGFSLKFKAFPGDFGDHKANDGKASEAVVTIFFSVKKMTDYNVLLNCQYMY